LFTGTELTEFDTKKWPAMGAETRGPAYHFL